MKYCIQHLVWIFTHFMLLASFLAPKNRKPKIFWYFQGVQEETTNIKRVNYPSPPVWLCTREREREKERERERERERETERERQRETETETETDRQRETERDRERVKSKRANIKTSDRRKQSTSSFSKNEL